MIIQKKEGWEKEGKTEIMLFSIYYFDGSNYDLFLRIKKKVNIFKGKSKNRNKNRIFKTHKL
jgi:hypothetical protein